MMLPRSTPNGRSLGSVFLLLFGGLLLAGGLSTSALAQTPITTLQNSNSNTRLQLNANGSLYVPGTRITDGTEDGLIPAEGAGTRMMWYPAKAAFRAGEVGGSQWDASDIGDHSVALGHDTRASGDGALAMGFSAFATGRNSVATGRFTSANGLHSTAMGISSIANGNDAAAIGTRAIAETDGSLSIGECNDYNRNLGVGSTLLAVGNGAYDPNAQSCSSTSVAFIVDDNGTAVADAHVTFSDRRLKTEIETLDGGILKKLSQLRPVQYQFKDQDTHPSGEQIGLIA